jgi:hypothetical protein
VPRTTTRRRNLSTHLTAAVVVPACLALCWWQVTRALSGNSLSWAYVFEWPIFAGYAVFMWWKLIHEPRPGAETGPTDEGTHGDGPSGTDSRPEDEDEEDEDLACYNRYLAALNASGRRKRW